MTPFLLSQRGVVTLGGPLDDGEEVLLVLAVPDEQSARIALQPDPWHAAGLVETVSVRRWTILLQNL